MEKIGRAITYNEWMKFDASATLEQRDKIAEKIVQWHKIQHNGESFMHKERCTGRTQWMLLRAIYSYYNLGNSIVVISMNGASAKEHYERFEAFREFMKLEGRQSPENIGYKIQRFFSVNDLEILKGMRADIFVDHACHDQNLITDERSALLKAAAIKQKPELEASSVVNSVKLPLSGNISKAVSPLRGSSAAPIVDEEEELVNRLNSSGNIY